MAIPRGLANRNPGNIRHSDAPWMGQATVQPDPDFVTFTEPLYGIRALARTLLTYQTRHGLKTLREIIDRWAPPSDHNDTLAYLDDVSVRTGLLPDKPLDLASNPLQLQSLCAAIITHENGRQPFALTVLADGVQLAISGRDTA
jgi:hypothetical protein